MNTENYSYEVNVVRYDNCTRKKNIDYRGKNKVKVRYFISPDSFPDFVSALEEFGITYPDEKSVIKLEDYKRNSADITVMEMLPYYLGFTDIGKEPSDYYSIREKGKNLVIEYCRLGNLSSLYLPCLLTDFLARRGIIKEKSYVSNISVFSNLHAQVQDGCLRGEMVVC